MKKPYENLPVINLISKYNFKKEEFEHELATWVDNVTPKGHKEKAWGTFLWIID